MCGIAGIISNKNIDHLKGVVHKMNNLQKHRGLDGEGYWFSEKKNVYLGHRRLAIIDLSESGIQPLSSCDKMFTITYNGELYNYQELKKKCILKGSKFFSNTDTEVIIEYIRWFGVKGIMDFRGMWAFVLYNTQNNTVVISRDHFGIKPLYYALNDECLYFASEIKAIRLISEEFNVIDEITKQIFLDYGYLDIGEWTFFKNIRRFPQASYAEISLDKKVSVNTIKYWVPSSKEISKLDENSAKEQLQFLLKQSIERHLVSETEIAFCLSGGLDSSTILSLAAKNNNKINTFTAHHPNFKEIDEVNWANLVNKHLNCKSHLIEIKYQDFINEFEEVLYYHDEPFGSTSVYAQNSIFKAINHYGFKVSIDGQGADEIFAGYNSYRFFFLKYLLKERKIFRLLFELNSLLKNPFNLISYILLYSKRFFNRYSENNLITNSEEYKQRLLKINKSLKAKNFNDFLVKALTISSIPQLLRNGDRNSMKNHVESRTPFLDIDLVDFVISLPENFKIKQGITKYLLRRVAINYLPNQIVNRKDKLGFPTPEYFWLEKAFSIKTNGILSRRWRTFIVQKWEEMLLSNKIY